MKLHARLPEPFIWTYLPPLAEASFWTVGPPETFVDSASIEEAAGVGEGLVPGGVGEGVVEMYGLSDGSESSVTLREFEYTERSKLGVFHG